MAAIISESCDIGFSLGTKWISRSTESDKRRKERGELISLFSQNSTIARLFATKSDHCMKGSGSTKLNHTVNIKGNIRTAIEPKKSRRNIRRH